MPMAKHAGGITGMSRDMNKRGFTIHETGDNDTSMLNENNQANTPVESTLKSVDVSGAMSSDLKHNKMRTPLVISLIVAGCSLLFLSYLTDSIILTFIGLGLTLWGVLLLYVTQSRYVPDEIVSAIPFSLVKSIDTLVRSHGCNGRTIILHPKTLKGMEQGYIFIPAEDEDKVPTNEQLLSEKLIQDNPKGILIPSPSQSLASFFETKLNVNFATTDLGYLQEKMPSLLVDTLRIADDVSLEKGSDSKIFTLRIQGGPWIDVCKRIGTDTQIGNHMGCPMCGAFGLILSKVSAKPIKIKQTTTSDDLIETVYQSIDEK